MFLQASKSTLRGSVPMPGSKSHTVRAAILATLARGESLIRYPLDSLDTRAAVNACRHFGAEFDTSDPECWRVVGTNGKPSVPDDVVDVANSGTTLYVAMATAALCRGGWTILNGDEQIRRRPADKLIQALRELGVDINSTRGNGMCPLMVRGPLKGGNTSIEAITSQWVTAILLNAPFAETDVDLSVPIVNEAPYIQITLDWLEKLGVRVDYEPDFSHFHVPAGQSWDGFDLPIAADFSSASFFLVAGAALDADIELTGLDLSDSQGDKAVIDYLREMGADIQVAESGNITIKRGELHGADLDLNATPDALPAMAVAAALASGTTRLMNVAQARVKETDRIAVMALELAKIGVEVEEKPDGLVIHGTDGNLKPSQILCGHDDHRIVMALSLAAMSVSEPSRIDTAEALAVTFPDFIMLMNSLNANMETIS